MTTTYHHHLNQYAACVEMRDDWLETAENIPRHIPHCIERANYWHTQAALDFLNILAQLAKD